MPLTSLPAPEPGLEAPTAFAELEIDIGYAFPWGFPPGKVRPGRAHDSIITLGILGSVFVGIAGAVITLRRSPDLVVPAFAELALAGTSAVLIAARPAAGRRAAGGGRRKSVDRQRPPGRQRPLAWRLPAAIRGQRLTLASGWQRAFVVRLVRPKILRHSVPVTGDLADPRPSHQKPVNYMLYGQQN